MGYEEIESRAHVAAEECILIVDDDVALCDALSEFVEGLGVACITEHNGNAGLRALTQVAPRVAIIDIQMPAMNGFELVRLASERYPDLRLVLMSGAERADLVGIKGFDDKFLVLQKPLPLEQLAAFLRRSLGLG